MSMLELFTNKEKTKKDEVDVGSPAFSLTKAQATLGLLITAVLGAVPASLQADRAVVIAAIAAGAVVMLGVFYLAGIDIKTRQRAAEAALRFPDEEGPSAAEYRVRMAEVKKGKVEILASNDGDFIIVPFTEGAKSK